VLKVLKKKEERLRMGTGGGTRLRRRDTIRN